MQSKDNTNSNADFAFENYKILRKEADDCIQKQENLSTIIFSVLSISIVLNNKFESVLFLISILLTSAVLLSRIIHYRNTVYYISSYLSLPCSLHVSRWEKLITDFKKEQKSIKNNKFLIFSYGFASIFKNFINLILCKFIFIQIVCVLFDSNEPLLLRYFLLVCSILGLTLNLIFTITICTDKSLKSQYMLIWKKVIKQDEEQKLCQQKRN